MELKRWVHIHDAGCEGTAASDEGAKCDCPSLRDSVVFVGVESYDFERGLWE